MAPNFLVRPTVAGSPVLSADGAQAMTAVLDMGTHRINNVTDPSSAQDAATKNYVDTTVLSLTGGTLSGQLKLDGNLLLSMYTQDYLLSGSSQYLDIQAQTSALAAAQRFFAKDGDGTDDVYFQLFGKGTPSSLTNVEYLSSGWDNANSWFSIRSINSGTGTLRPLRIYTGSNTSQLVLNTDGTVTFGNGITGQLKLDTTLLLSNAGEDYLFTNDTNNIAWIQGQTAATLAAVAIAASDADGTDDIYFQLWGVGKPGSTVNRERLLFQWDSTNSRYNIATENSGTGTLRPLRIYTGSNTNQVILNTDGTTQINAPSLVFNVAGSTIQSLRQTSSTSLMRGVAHFGIQSTGSSVDGFGPMILFTMADSTAVDTYNTLGEVGAVRNGADNTGKVVIRSVNAGVETEVASFDNNQLTTLQGGLVAVAGTFSGQIKADSTLLLSDSANSGSQDYMFTSRSSAYVLQSQTAGGNFELDLMTKNGDGTDTLRIDLFGLGTPSAVTNVERLSIQWDVTNSRYNINSTASGTGTTRPIRIYTGTRTGQLVLNTDGTISLDYDLTINDANLVFGTTTGTKIGTATTQKLGFYNATPIVRPSAYTQTYSTADKTLATPTAAAITNNTGGSISTTFAAITAGASYAQADMTATKNALASTADQLGKLRADILDTNQMLNSLIDDLQALGLIG